MGQLDSIVADDSSSSDGLGLDSSDKDDDKNVAEE